MFGKFYHFITNKKKVLQSHISQEILRSQVAIRVLVFPKLVIMSNISSKVRAKEENIHPMWKRIKQTLLWFCCKKIFKLICIGIELKERVKSIEEANDQRNKHAMVYSLKNTSDPKKG